MERRKRDLNKSISRLSSLCRNLNKAFSNTCSTTTKNKSHLLPFVRKEHYYRARFRAWRLNPFFQGWKKVSETPPFPFFLSQNTTLLLSVLLPDSEPKKQLYELLAALEKMSASSNSLDSSCESYSDPFVPQEPERRKKVLLQLLNSGWGSEERRRNVLTQSVKKERILLLLLHMRIEFRGGGEAAVWIR